MKNILTFASDPGGANSLVPVIKQINMKKYSVVNLADGYTNKIYFQSGVDCYNIKHIDDVKLDKLIGSCVLFIFGTSWGKSLDKDILNKISSKHTKSVAIVDFWTNYQVRFGKVLPDFICVMDSAVKTELVNIGIPAGIIKVTGNPYFDSFLRNIRSGKEEKNKILFISQPLFKQNNNSGINEIKILEDIIKTLNEFGQSFNLVLRLHPLDDKMKYNNYLDKNITLDNLTLNDSLSRASVVIGMNSVVLFQAVQAGKQVISYKPHNKSTSLWTENQFRLGIQVKSKKALKKIMALALQNKLERLRCSKMIKPIATKNVINLIEEVLH